MDQTKCRIRPEYISPPFRSVSLSLSRVLCLRFRTMFSPGKIERSFCVTCQRRESCVAPFENSSSRRGRGLRVLNSIWSFGPSGAGAGALFLHPYSKNFLTNLLPPVYLTPNPNLSLSLSLSLFGIRASFQSKSKFYSLSTATASGSSSSGNCVKRGTAGTRSKAMGGRGRS